MKKAFLHSPKIKASPLALALITGFAATAVLPLDDLMARAGRGGSVGSRGSRTYIAPPPTRTAPYTATPFTHTITPQTPNQMPNFSNRAVPPYAPQPVTRQPIYRSHPFATGFFGGLLGAGLFGLLSGHGLLNFHGVGSFLGIIFQLILLFFVIRWLYSKLFPPQKNTIPFSPTPEPKAEAILPAYSYASSNQNTPVNLTHDDYMSFQKALINIQTAWSQKNIAALQRFATPEMVSYFNQQLTDLSSRGLQNTVSDIRFEQGDLSEAWQENSMQYATVSMKYSMVDVTTDMTGRVVEGDPDQRVSVTEIWTFVRSQQNGYWLLSAIQQTRS
ncbi:Tim44 domain-containing protein [Entomobacter blattae]|uniref:Tim44-like domain protein n=1 Tax=Entomobacter blattae TaxID=2762277 RepID=A0A7H1NRT7_9PROT|nr:TIM44-like domain-containing protein [Entomobacter blattae]QNT78497.1 Tim44-like domain protein [Entomobacter blattae]